MYRGAEYNYPGFTRRDEGLVDTGAGTFAKSPPTPSKSVKKRRKSLYGKGFYLQEPFCTDYFSYAYDREGNKHYERRRWDGTAESQIYNYDQAYRLTDAKYGVSDTYAFSIPNNSYPLPAGWEGGVK